MSTSPACLPRAARPLSTPTVRIARLTATIAGLEKVLALELSAAERADYEEALLEAHDRRAEARCELGAAASPILRLHWLAAGAPVLAPYRAMVEVCST